MKKKIALLSLFIITNILQAQKVSYGIILGIQGYGSIENTSVYHFDADKSFIPNYGGYLEYGFNNNIGVKAEVNFNTKNIIYTPLLYNPNEIGYPYTLNIIEFCPSVKFDFGKEYQKGFYMLLGPKFSFITKSKNDKGNDADDIFETKNKGIQLGLGTRIGKFIDFETKLDYEITPFFKVPNTDRKSNFAGVYILFNLDLE